MEKLNTIDSFRNDGFKIVRAGKIITLTPEEMSDFRYLDTALTGQDCLETYKGNASQEETYIIDKMLSDEEICYNIEDEILNSLYEDVHIVEQDVIKRCIEKYMPNIE